MFLHRLNPAASILTSGLSDLWQALRPEMGRYIKPSNELIMNI